MLFFIFANCTASSTWSKEIFFIFHNFLDISSLNKITTYSRNNFQSFNFFKNVEKGNMFSCLLDEKKIWWLVIVYQLNFV